MMVAAEGAAAAGVLSGRHVVVTRPQAQARTLCEAIRREGGVPVAFPVLEILDVTDDSALLDAIVRLETFSIAVFVSPNAVERAMGAILARRSWPAGLRAAAIGHSSEAALAACGVRDVIAPRERFDSEALLERPELAPDAVNGCDIVIFRGDGGRELLAEELRARGARITYAPCYRRGVPAADAGALMALWREGRLDAVTLTSSEGLRNLWALLEPAGREWLRETPVFVPHERIAEAARALGLARVVLTAPADAGLLQGLRTRFAAAAMPS